MEAVVRTHDGVTKEFPGRNFTEEADADFAHGFGMVRLELSRRVEGLEARRGVLVNNWDSGRDGPRIMYVHEVSVCSLEKE
jgi:hypothetical protein